MADHLIAQLGRLGLTLDKTGATLVLYPDSATGATVPLKAASTASLSGKVAVKLAAYPAAMPEGGLLPFLVVPAATDLSGVAFDWQGVGYGQPVGEIVVSDPMDGILYQAAQPPLLQGPPPLRDQPPGHRKPPPSTPPPSSSSCDRRPFEASKPRF